MSPEELAAVAAVDAWLDDKVGQDYKDQPLAQDWARVCKETEEKGESIAELILATLLIGRGVDGETLTARW